MLPEDDRCFWLEWHGPHRFLPHAVRLFRAMIATTDAVTNMIRHRQSSPPLSDDSWSHCFLRASPMVASIVV